MNEGLIYVGMSGIVFGSVVLTFVFFEATSQGWNTVMYLAIGTLSIIIGWLFTCLGTRTKALPVKESVSK